MTCEGDDLVVPVDAFIHPLDRRGADLIDSYVTSRPKVAAKLESVMQGYLTESLKLNLADNTRLGGSQFPSLHALVAEAASGLGIETPDVFLDTAAEPNAFALGRLQGAHLVFTSGLVESFSDAEIAAVAGHELGHVIADHSFYRAAAGEGFRPIEMLLSAVPGGSLAALALKYLLADWYRKSELTADRAALLATGDLEGVQSTIIRLAGGTSDARHGALDADAFMEQAREFRDVVLQAESDNRTLLDRVQEIAGRLMAEAEHRSHPWPALRYLEITEWSETEQCGAALTGDWDTARAAGESQLPAASQKSQVLDEDLTSQVAEAARLTGDALKSAWRKRSR